MATWTNPMIGNHDNPGQRYGDPRDGYVHRGYDIGTAGVTGRPVVAGSAGTVTVSAFSANKRGEHVLIDHGGGIRTLYQHLALNSRSVTVGQTVATGQQVGICGNTGGDYDIHLHLQVMDKGSGTSWNDNTDTTDPKAFFALRGVALGADAPILTPTDPTPTTPSPEEDPMFVAINKSTSMGALIYPNGKWILVTDGADAAALSAAGVPTVAFSSGTWTNLTPSAQKLV